MNWMKTHPEATAPVYATDGSGAMDMRAVSVKWVPRTWDAEKKKYTGGYFEYDTGIALEIPPGYIGHGIPRSSSSDMDMTLSNSAGFIDSDYRGSVKARYHLRPPVLETVDTAQVYKPGDIVLQLAIVPILKPMLFEVKELSKTGRNGGFGSTGN